MPKAVAGALSPGPPSASGIVNNNDSFESKTFLLTEKDVLVIICFHEVENKIVHPVILLMLFGGSINELGYCLVSPVKSLRSIVLLILPAHRHMSNNTPK